MWLLRKLRDAINEELARTAQVIFSQFELIIYYAWW